MSVEFKGKVRARDGEPSWEAAARQNDEKVDAVKDAIVYLLNAYGKSTDEELVDLYEAYVFTNPSTPPVTPQSVRTRRHALLLEGRVVNTNERRRTRSGSTGAVWAVK
ncbi:hypothetical protein [Subtercola endophyticus]|uniref:hypothetical protein n=1 Tax=Subtercola endophyticus TaxID=2895559 RepID=UPI001E5893FC|nr:hypothetical protein [Subtercola endophyticus]UFS58919.1 hypothetical protein LQ955_18310 [Subtercola endophyticus]